MEHNRSQWENTQTSASILPLSSSPIQLCTVETDRTTAPTGLTVDNQIQLVYNSSHSEFAIWIRLNSTNSRMRLFSTASTGDAYAPITLSTDSGTTPTISNDTWAIRWDSTHNAVLWYTKIGSATTVKHTMMTDRLRFIPISFVKRELVYTLSLSHCSRK